MEEFSKQTEKSEWTRKHAAHLLKRSSFSGSRYEIDECHHLGLAASVELILKGQQPGAVGKLDSSRLEPKFLLSLPTLPNEKKTSSQRSVNVNDRYERKLFTLQMEWLQRMLDNGGPLEKMVLFWHGMLTSSYIKVQSVGFMVRQNQLFRELAFGDYRELVKRVLLDPAMIVYLDIDMNKRSKPNENFARELLELFTLGEGNYAPSLIKKIAREIVGIKLARNEDNFPYGEDDLKGIETNSGFADQRRRLSELVDSVFELPVCGELLVRRLWKFYVSEDLVNEDEIKVLAYDLRKSGWKVSTVLRKIFRSKKFYNTSVMAQQIKSPVQYLVQAHKELEMLSIDPKSAYYAMQKLGQSLFNPPNVSGWKAGKTWINGTTISARYELSKMMSSVAIKQKSNIIKKMFDLIAKNELLGRKILLDHFIGTSLPASKSEMFTAMVKRVKNEEHVGIFMLYLMCMPEYQLC